MKLVFLDIKTIGKVPNMQLLEQFGEVIYHDITNPGQTLERERSAEVIITNKVVLNRSTIMLLPIVLTTLYLPRLLSIIWMLIVPLLLFFWRINILHKNRDTQNYKRIDVTNCLSMQTF